MIDRDRISAALPGYDIGEEIGRGAWGVVMQAEHRRLRRPVAVKQLARAFAADPAVRARFATEGQLLAALDHPHIVPIFDYVEQDELCLLVMELLSGGTVWDRLQSKSLSPQASCAGVLAACCALEHAHGHGILHRDIKPENMIFSAWGTMKVSDFGIAKVVVGSASRAMATRAGEVLGTPAYMAPEQASGTQLSPATDIYALGLVLFELLSGRLPFLDDGDPLGLLYRHVHDDPTPLRDVAPDVPNPLAAVVMKALSRPASSRQDSAEELGIAIASAARDAWGPNWADGSGVTVLATGRLADELSDAVPSKKPLSSRTTLVDPVPASAAAAPPVAPAVALAPAAPAPQSRRPSPRGAVVGAALILVALVALAVMLAGGGGR